MIESDAGRRSRTSQSGIASDADAGTDADAGRRKRASHRTRTRTRDIAVGHRIGRGRGREKSGTINFGAQLNQTGEHGDDTMQEGSSLLDLLGSGELEPNTHIQDGRTFRC